MTTRRFIPFMLFAACLLPSANFYAQQTTVQNSNAVLPDENVPAAGTTDTKVKELAAVSAPEPRVPRPVLAITGGTLGAGLEFTASISNKVALRSGFHAINLTLHFEEDKIPYAATAVMRSATVQIDIAPRGGNFRISPGLMVYNNMGGSAHAVVPAGNSFDMGDGTYVSNASDPITADAALKLGNSLSPMLTFGFRSILPRRWRFTMPVEFGAVYTGTPKFTLNMSGSACDQNNQCGNLATDAEAQRDLEKERQSWNDTISQIKAYPIVSIGLGYRFGGTRNDR